MSLPCLCASFTSRRNWVPLIGVRNDRIPVLEKRVGGTVPLPLGAAGGAHGLDGCGVRNPHFEGQCLPGSHTDRRHANRVRNRDPHPGQGFGRLLLGFLVHANVNHVDHDGSTAKHSSVRTLSGQNLLITLLRRLPRIGVH